MAKGYRRINGVFEEIPNDEVVVKTIEPIKSRGLGDTIDKFTTFTGIKAGVKAVASVVGIEDCGCSARQEMLNEKFPYKP